jgi:hypothetical protein
VIESLHCPIPVGDLACRVIRSLGVTTKPVSLRDAAGLVNRVRRALASGVGDVRSNDTVNGLLAIAEQWVDEQERAQLTDLTERPVEASC